MLSRAKHCYHATRVLPPATTVAMLRGARCNVLFGALCLLLGLVHPAQAQDAVLRGLVLDADTHQPIPNAQVGVGGNKLGTSTNVEGRFALRVPAAYQTGELEVALLGYRRYTRALPPLPSPELRIELKINPAGLGTVAITASATGIIRKAVARIAQNYPGRPTRLTGFLRESAEDATVHRYEYLAEGVLLVHKPLYQRPRSPGDVQVLEARKVDLRPRQPGAAALPAIDWVAGPFIPHRFDFVHQRAEFISAAHFKDYQYQFGAQTTFQGRAVYVITFRPKPGTDRANFAGQVYIDEQNYAFLGAEWHRTPAGIRRERVLLFTATERAYRVDYQRYAGRYHLKSVWYNTLGQPLAGRVRRHLAEFVTTAIDTAQAPPPTYRERTQYADVFLASPVPYDSTFWNHYTTSLPPTQLRLDLLAQPSPLRADTVPPPKAGKSESWLSKVASRLSYTYAAGVLPLAGPAAVVRAVVAPVNSTFRADGEAAIAKPSAAFCLGLGAQVALTKSLAAYGLQRTLLGGQLKGEGWEAGLHYERNLNPHGRPLLARVGLGYVRQAVARALGTFDNPDDNLRLAGTRLAASRVAVALQTQTTALQPKLGLGLELSHQLEAVADLGYLLPLRTRSQLRLQEVNHGFFSANYTATLLLPAAEAQVFVDGQPAAAAPWRPGRLLLLVGICYRLQRR